MEEFNYPSKEIIIKLNEEACLPFNNDIGILNDSIMSFESSISYIDTIEGKISSIVVSIARNHNFRDGNKRTSMLLYYVLCDLNNIEAKSNIQDDILQIVVSRMNWEEAKEILFDQSNEIEEDVNQDKKIQKYITKLKDQGMHPDAIKRAVYDKFGILLDECMGGVGGTLTSTGMSPGVSNITPGGTNKKKK